MFLTRKDKRVSHRSFKVIYYGRRSFKSSKVIYFQSWSFRNWKNSKLYRERQSIESPKKFEIGFFLLNNFTSSVIAPGKLERGHLLVIYFKNLILLDILSNSPSCTVHIRTPLLYYLLWHQFNCLYIGRGSQGYRRKRIGGFRCEKRRYTIQNYPPKLSFPSILLSTIA